MIVNNYEKLSTTDFPARNKERDYRIGDVVVVDFSYNEREQERGKRPAIVLSNNRNNTFGASVTVASITRASNRETSEESVYKYRLNPYQVMLNNEEEGLNFLKHSSVVSVSDIVSIPKENIHFILGNVPKIYKVRIAKTLHDFFRLGMISDFDSDKGVSDVLSGMVEQEDLLRTLLSERELKSVGENTYIYSMLKIFGELSLNVVTDNSEGVYDNIGDLLVYLVKHYVQMGVDYSLSGYLKIDVSDKIFRPHYTVHDLNLHLNQLLFVSTEKRHISRKLPEVLDSVLKCLILISDNFGFTLYDCFKSSCGRYRESNEDDLDSWEKQELLNG